MSVSTHITPEEGRAPQPATARRGKPTGGSTPQNVDQFSGNPLKGLRPDIEDAYLDDRIKVDEPEEFEPVTVWTAGLMFAQQAIKIPGRPGKLRTDSRGAYVCRSKLELETLKRALGRGQFWKENLDPEDDDLICESCKWHCRSYPAMMYHQNHAHGRDQAQ